MLRVSLKFCARGAAIVLRATTTLFFTIHLSLSWSEEAYGDENISTCHTQLERCLTDMGGGRSIDHGCDTRMQARSREQVIIVLDMCGCCSTSVFVLPR
jgi:hypothetical protein